MTFFRYIVIQVLAYGIDMGGFLGLFHSGLLGPLTANVIAKLAAGIFAFAAHRAFTFRTSDPADRMHQAVRYFILLALNIPLSSGVLAVALRWISLPAAAKFMADAICVALTYWLSKSFVFIRKPRPIADHAGSEGTGI